MLQMYSLTQHHKSMPVTCLLTKNMSKVTIFHSYKNIIEPYKQDQPLIKLKICTSVASLGTIDKHYPDSTSLKMVAKCTLLTNKQVFFPIKTKKETGVKNSHIV